VFTSKPVSVDRLLEFGAFAGPRRRDPARSSLVIFPVPLLELSQACHKLNPFVLILVAARRLVMSGSPPV